MEDSVEILVPVALFLCLFGAFAVHRLFRHRSQQEVQKTLRQALESGATLSPEMIESLIPPPSPDADLRRGVIALMLAVATTCFAIFIGEEDAIGPLVGIACFPLFLSFGYFWLARGAKRS